MSHLIVRRLIVENFRSIARADVELAPITVIYGPNSSGKSSLIYALLTLRNIVLKPMSEVSEFFDYKFMNLGGFEEVVFRHSKQRTIRLEISVNPSAVFLLESKWIVRLETGSDSLTIITPESKYKIKYKIADIIPKHLHYGIRFRENIGIFRIEIEDMRSELKVKFPYSGNKVTRIEKDGLRLLWNGLATMIESSASGASDDAKAYAGILNSPVEALRRARFIPVRRGFSNFTYMPVPVSPLQITENEVATILAGDRELEDAVSRFLEIIADRQLRVRPQIGTTLFQLHILDRQAGVAVELTNEGFGINQLVYLLAQALQREGQLIAIEEPEIDLHPCAVRRLARALVRILREYPQKQFLISTHSETFVVALLAQVAERLLRPDELACYLAERVEGETRFTRQEVNEHGQIEGGLRSFIEAELEDLRAFLGAS